MRKPKGTLALTKAPIPAEWDCLTPAEFAVCKSVREQLGAEAFEALPLDTLVCFVRGYAHEKDWHASCIEHLTATLAWLVLGQTFSLLTYASLLPVAAGVALSAVSELQFSLFGFAASRYGVAALERAKHPHELEEEPFDYP